MTRLSETSILTAIEKNPGDVGRTMIGDRRHDLLGAIANDMRPIGVAWGYGSIEELRDAGAAAIASEPTDLAELLG